jgi:hypothetical protein
MLMLYKKNHISCLLCAAFFLAALLHGDGRAAGAEYLQKKIDTIDSIITLIPSLPEARMKEVAPVNVFFRKIITQYPEIVLIMRTNSKGAIVNYVDKEGENAGLGSGVADSDWYAMPKKNMAPWYGKLTKENRRSCLLWSRPLGGERFGGVVAFKIDITTCFKDFALTTRGPFQILLDGKSFYYLSWNDGVPFKEYDVAVPGGIIFTVRLAKTAGVKDQDPKASGSVSKKEEKKEPGSGSSRAVIPQGTRIALNDKNSRSDIPGKNGSQEPRPSSYRNLGPILFGTAVFLTLVFLGGVIFSRLRKRNTLATINRARHGWIMPHKVDSLADDEKLYPAPDRISMIDKREAAASLTETIAEPVPVTVKMGRAPSPNPLSEEDRAMIKEQERKKAEEQYARQVREDVLMELSQQIRESVRRENEVCFRAEAVENLRSEIKRTLEECGREELLSEVRREAAKEIRKEMEQELRVTLRDELTALVRKQLDEQERNSIYKNELEILTGVIRRQIVENEMPGLIAEHRRRLDGEMREKVAESLTEKYQEQARAALQKEIAEKVLKEDAGRITTEETNAFRESVQRRLAEKARADVKTGIGEEYRRLMDTMERLSGTLASSDALDSLGQTITLLSEEKKKYKYFNLNTAQTESLLDYLKRVHSRFNIYLDQVDQNIRELMLSLGTVKNKLDNEE